MSKSGGSTPQPPASIPLPKSRKGLGGFFAEVNRELKKVHWPPARETNRLTGVVLIVSGGMILLLTGLSYVIEILLNLLTRGSI